MSHTLTVSPAPIKSKKAASVVLKGTSGIPGSLNAVGRYHDDLSSDTTQHATAHSKTLPDIARAARPKSDLARSRYAHRSSVSDTGGDSVQSRGTVPMRDGERHRRGAGLDSAQRQKTSSTSGTRHAESRKYNSAVQFEDLASEGQRLLSISPESTRTLEKLRNMLDCASVSVEPDPEIDKQPLDDHIKNGLSPTDSAPFEEFVERAKESLALDTQRTQLEMTESERRSHRRVKDTLRHLKKEEDLWSSASVFGSDADLPRVHPRLLQSSRSKGHRRATSAYHIRATAFQVEERHLDDLGASRLPKTGILLGNKPASIFSDLVHLELEHIATRQSRSSPQKPRSNLSSPLIDLSYHGINAVDELEKTPSGEDRTFGSLDAKVLSKKVVDDSLPAEHERDKQALHETIPLSTSDTVAKKAVLHRRGVSVPLVPAPAVYVLVQDSKGVLSPIKVAKRNPSRRSRRATFSTVEEAKQPHDIVRRKDDLRRRAERSNETQSYVNSRDKKFFAFAAMTGNDARSIDNVNEHYVVFGKSSRQHDEHRF